MNSLNVYLISIYNNMYIIGRQSILQILYTKKCVYPHYLYMLIKAYYTP